MDFSLWRSSGATAEAWLRYVTSFLALGELPASAIRQTIDELMNQGHYADEYLPALDDYAGFAEHLVPALHAAMRNFGIAMPDRSGAIRQIIAFHLGAIAEGREDPLEGFKRVLDAVRFEDEFSEGYAHFLGDSFGVEKLVGLYHAVDDLHDSRLEEIRQAMREEAQHWIEHNRSDAKAAVQGADRRRSAT